MPVTMEQMQARDEMHGLTNATNATGASVASRLTNATVPLQLSTEQASGAQTAGMLVAMGFFSYAARLDDLHAIRLMAAAAAHIYMVGMKDEFSRGGATSLQLQHFNRWDGTLQWAIYSTSKGSILAFMGTDFPNDWGARSQQLWQDKGIPMGDNSFRNARDQAIDVVRRYRPTWVTGHSLGGILAECAASYTGTKGAVFGAPGPVGFPNLAGDNYAGVPFRVIIHSGDPARNIGRITGYKYSHIVYSGDVWWLSGGSEFNKHGMNSYTSLLGRLP
jgi:hypothetical protein